MKKTYNNFDVVGWAMLLLKIREFLLSDRQVLKHLFEINQQLAAIEKGWDDRIDPFYCDPLATFPFAFILKSPSETDGMK